MTYDNFTIKAQEAILQAQQIAAGYEQQSVDTGHLLKGMLAADDSVTAFLLKKAGVNMARFTEEVDKLVWETPKVQGADKQYLTNEANKAVAAAKTLLKDFGDEYISVELLLLGIVKGNDKAARLLRENGATLDALSAAVNPPLIDPQSRWRGEHDQLRVEFPSAAGGRIEQWNSHAG